jgi:hypothetical protein
MATKAEREAERRPLINDFDNATNKGNEADQDHQAVLSALSLCTFFSFAVQSVTNTQLLAASQLEYVTDGPWFFVLVQSVPIIAGTLVSFLANQYDDAFDQGFGIARTMHFRIVIVGLLTSILAVGIAVIQDGYVQVVLGFFCAFCAIAAQVAAFQLVAALDPKWQAASTSAIVLSNLVPILAVDAVGADVSAHWTVPQRVWVFVPSVVLALVATAVFAKYWPEASRIEGESQPGSPVRPAKDEDPSIAIASPRVARSDTATGLTRGLRRLSKTVDDPTLEPIFKWAPFPYWLVSVASFINGVTYFVYPLVALTPNSGSKAALIIARFWGEVVGQGCGVALVFLGLASANLPSVAVFLILTAGRLVALIWIVPLLLLGKLPPWPMFAFRATEGVLYCTGTPIVLLAAPLSERKEVLRSDVCMHFVSGLVGVGAALYAVLALAGA